MTYFNDDGSTYDRGPLEGPRPGTNEYLAKARLLEGEYERRRTEAFGESASADPQRSNSRSIRRPYRPILSPKLAVLGALLGIVIGFAAVAGAKHSDASGGLAVVTVCGFLGALAGWILLEVLKWALFLVVSGIILLVAIWLLSEFAK